MRFSRLVAATALVAAMSFSSFATAEEESANVTQCRALGNQEKYKEAEPFCIAAAQEPAKIGKLLYGDLVYMKGDPKAAIPLYTEVLKDVDLAKATQAELTALA